MAALGKPIGGHRSDARHPRVQVALEGDAHHRERTRAD
jgi:hypothetical protein